MEQLNLFSRITSGLALMRGELRLQYEIAQYRRELRDLADIDDSDYVKPQTDRLIFLIENLFTYSHSHANNATSCNI
jgi:hypothetical protein